MNPEINETLFTVNGFNFDSRANTDPRSFIEDQFMVWGWMMSRARWPLVKSQFTWLGNWDHQMQKMRKDNKLVSITPLLSRTKHVGMVGINFRVHDPESQSIWQRVYIETDKVSIDYDEEEPNIFACSSSV
jgi:hypothetical protein